MVLAFQSDINGRQSVEYAVLNPEAVVEDASPWTVHSAKQIRELPSNF